MSGCLTATWSWPVVGLTWLLCVEATGCAVASSAADSGRSGISERRHTCVAEPKRHRSSSVCDGARPPGEIAGPAHFKPLCQSDADCTDGLNGRCTRYASHWYTDGHASLRCTYDACTTDADCGTGEICHCGEGLGENLCVPASCRVDSDCDAGYCSPSITLSGSNTEIEYACHTCEDDCVDDAECGPDPGEREQSCLWLRNRKHWACMHPLTAIE
jgi:hypothetical protein